MKIDKVTAGHVAPSSLTQASRQPQDKPIRQTLTEPQLNANIAAIEQAQQSLATLPDVDMEKIASIKNALQRGELDLNMQALSQAIMKFHSGHD